jgi:Protein of unknown function (DUF3667)/Domain of unknown function (DUF4286)
VQPRPDNRSVLYEVNLEADAAIAGPFDTWLRDHIADMLQFEGFRSAEILDDTAAPPGRILRVVQYRLRDQAALDDYLANHAPRMRAQGVALFGEQFSAGRRVLPHREELVRGAVSTENCLNCGEVLTGQHCSHCGQHARVRVLSLWELIKDVLGDLLDADSRVWRTLWPLAFRPGLLTREFLRGRRALYTPPFRMYLVLSVVFFLLASISDPGADVAFQIDEGGTNLQLRQGTASGSTGPAAAADSNLEQDARQFLEQAIERLPESERATVRADLEKEIAQATPAELEAARRFMSDPCSEKSLRIDAGPFLEQYEPRLRSACRRIMADQQSFGRALFENIPKMMFIFLPLIAAVMSLLYLRSGRYYVEHLLFVVHFHAFFFLAGIVVLLLERLAGSGSGTVGSALAAVEGALGAALTLYVPWYLLQAMRRVYAQGWWKTLPKFALLGIAYFVSLVFTGIGLLAYTALSL